MNPITRATITVALAVAVIGWGPQALAQNRGRVQSSLLLLIDASGSMGDAIGSGNSQVKIEAAKQAAIAALGRAAPKRLGGSGGAGLQRRVPGPCAELSGLHP